MSRLFKDMEYTRASNVFLLLSVALVSVQCMAQGVAVSMKIDITSVSSVHQHSMRSMVPVASGDVVAWLTPMDDSVPLPPRATPQRGYRLTQRNKEFTPHLLVLPTGTSIDFPNEDPFFHNVFSLFNGKRFDLGLYEAGSRRSVRFDREGVSYIFCNIHPEMGAIVVSLNSPYYAVSTNNGSLTLANVLPGEYTLKFWAEGVAASELTAASRKITINKDSVALGTISFVRTANSMQHKNKFGEDYKPTNNNPY